MAELKNGSIVKFKGDAKVYLVDNGKLRHFTKEVKTKSGKSIFNFMVELDPSYKEGYTEGAKISGDIPFDPVSPGWEAALPKVVVKEEAPVKKDVVKPVEETPPATPGKRNFYKKGGSYYYVDNNEKILNEKDLAEASKYGVEVPEPTVKEEEKKADGGVMNIDSLANKESDLTKEEANWLEEFFGQPKDEYWKIKQQGSNFWAGKVGSAKNLVEWLKSGSVGIPEDSPYKQGSAPAQGTETDIQPGQPGFSEILPFTQQQIEAGKPGGADNPWVAPPAQKGDIASELGFEGTIPGYKGIYKGKEELDLNKDATNELFKQYHGRDATAEELGYWTGKKVGNLENVLSITKIFPGAQADKIKAAMEAKGLTVIKNQAHLEQLAKEGGLTEDQITRAGKAAGLMFAPTSLVDKVDAGLASELKPEDISFEKEPSTVIADGGAIEKNTQEVGSFVSKSLSGINKTINSLVEKQQKITADLKTKAEAKETEFADKLETVAKTDLVQAYKDELTARKFDENQTKLNEILISIEKEMESMNLGVIGEGERVAPLTIATRRQKAVEQRGLARIGALSAIGEIYQGNMQIAMDIANDVSGLLKQQVANEMNAYGTLLTLHNNKVMTLAEDEKEFVEMQMGLLENQRDQIETNKNSVMNMINKYPESAVKGGVTLLDTPEAAWDKMSQYVQDEVQKEKDGQRIEQDDDGNYVSIDETAGTVNQITVNKSSGGGQATLSIGSGVITGLNGSEKNAKGLDFVLAGGNKAEVSSPYNGTVIFADVQGGYGNRVGIAVEGGGEIWFSHFGSLNVSEGDTVSSGTILGIQGNTGDVMTSDDGVNYHDVSESERKAGKGTHLDIEMKDSAGNFLTPQEVAAELGYTPEVTDDDDDWTMDYAREVIDSNPDSTREELYSGMIENGLSSTEANAVLDEKGIENATKELTPIEEETAFYDELTKLDALGKSKKEAWDYLTKELGELNEAEIKQFKRIQGWGFWGKKPGWD